MRLLVTGGCGFIGSNFIRYALEHYGPVLITNVDSLTYAGNPANLAGVADAAGERYEFFHADISDQPRMNALFEKHSFFAVVNFAAESHVDRSIDSPGDFIHTNIVGTATILDAAGVPYPDTFEDRPVAPLIGKSLAPVLSATSDQVRAPDDWVGWELFGNRAVRRGDWKLLWLCEPAGTGDWQLYNLAQDPGETRDLTSERPEIRDQLLRQWDEYAAANNVILPDTSPVCDPAE